ncbi:B12-binding domain-containing radical SAM protein [Patescibacteria group bacterium]
MERFQNLIRFPELPEIKFPTLPDQREIIKFCLVKGFNNPLVQKVGDFIIENGRLGQLRDILIPYFEASEAIRGRIYETAKSYGIIPKKEINLRSPARIENPKAVSFKDKFKSEHHSESSKELPAQLDILLCTPSRYRNDHNSNKVNRYAAAFMPAGAIPVIEAATPSEIDGVKVKIGEFDDKVGDGIQISEIVEHALKNPDHKTVVCLTNVQTNQFTRAYDLAIQLRAVALKLNLNLEILIGGPHIRTHEPSVLDLQELRIVPVQGEIEEGRFSEILADILHEETKQKYNYPLVENISDVPLPKPTTLNGYVSYMITLQISRGCPHKCRFCSTIGFDGRRMRYKSVEEAELVYRAAIDEGIKTIFITDDNFFRNKNSRAILEMMARVRKEKGTDINIMFQSDLKVVKNGKIDTEFMDLCQEAGVYMIFFGQESFDPKVLMEQMDKKQNIIHIAKHLGKKIDEVTEEDVFNYTKMIIAEWQKRGVAVNYTCIVGMKGDKPGCGEEIAQRAQRLGADIVTPFIYTLLPGSADYEDYVNSPNAIQTREKVGMRLVDLKFNNADSKNANVEFEDGLTKDQQVEEFFKVLKIFFKVNRVKKHWNPSVIAYYLFHCLSASLNEHPMAAGIWRKENVERELSDTKRRKLENFIKANTPTTVKEDYLFIAHPALIQNNPEHEEAI